MCLWQLSKGVTEHVEEEPDLAKLKPVMVTKMYSAKEASPEMGLGAACEANVP